ncbi:MAG TPA: PAS domain S-box protein [Thermoanaerobaculia bacterium]|nr:PAS domain S-box protein [Thermoanaerobaculia bacterium]
MNSAFAPTSGSATSGSEAKTGTERGPEASAPPRDDSGPGFRQLAEVAPMGILVVGADEGLRYANPSAAAMLGRSVDDLLACRYGTLADPSCRDLLRQRIADRIAGAPVPGTYETLFRRADGSSVAVELSGNLLGWHGEPCDLLFLSDVTVRRNALAALEEEREAFRSVFENAGEAVFLTSPDGSISAANPAACRMLGRSEEEIRRLGRSGVLDLSDPRVPAALEERARTGRFHGELRALRVSGEAFPAEITSDLFTDAHGKPRSATILRDVTERRRAEEAFRRSEALVRSLNAELEQRVAERTEALAAANEELRGFSSSIAHDLTAPLRGINGLAGRLLEDHGSNLGEEARGLLRRIVEASARGGRLIEALLDHARISVARLEREAVDVGDLAAAILRRRAAEEPGRNVTWIAPSGLDARADRRLVGEILEHLLANAWKFTSPREAARIEVGAATEGGETVFFVRDDGVGFEPAHASRLFELFHRAHAGTELSGLGVGLALAERAVRCHGGWIRIDGAPGAGATVRFTLSPRR